MSNTKKPLSDVVSGIFKEATKAADKAIDNSIECREWRKWALIQLGRMHGPEQILAVDPIELQHALAELINKE